MYLYFKTVLLPFIEIPEDDCLQSCVLFSNFLLKNAELLPALEFWTQRNNVKKNSALCRSKE